MKNLLLFLSFLLLLSCSVQKRKYQKGFYVDRNHKKSRTENTASKKENKIKDDKPIVEQTATDAIINGKTNTLADTRKLIVTGLKKKFSFLQAVEDSCDLLIFKDGSEIRAKVEEVGINEIKYRRCDLPSGPMYVTKKSEIFMIKYMNGTKEIIKSEESVLSKNPDPTANNTYRSNKRVKEKHPFSFLSLALGIMSSVSAYILLFAIGNMSVVTFAVFIPLLFAILAVTLSTIGMNDINKQPDVYKGKGSLMPGMIMGCIVLAAYFIFTILFLIFA